MALAERRQRRSVVGADSRFLCRPTLENDTRRSSGKLKNFSGRGAWVELLMEPHCELQRSMRPDFKGVSMVEGGVFVGQGECPDSGQNYFEESGLFETKTKT